MKMRELYNKAVIIATKAHEDRTDKGGAPYITHPLRVAEKCSTMESKIVAVLHDVIEDTAINEEMLLNEGFPKVIVDAVVALSRTAGQSYYHYVEALKKNPIAREVKTHDLEDNLNILRLNRLIDEKDLERINKYIRCYHFLMSNEEEEISFKPF